MNAAHRLQTMIGLSLLIISVLGFVVMLITNLPKDSDVSAQAEPLKVLPRDFFSDNAITQEIKKLTVPTGVPVNLDANSVGRSNVFERY